MRSDVKSAGRTGTPQTLANIEIFGIIFDDLISHLACILIQTLLQEPSMLKIYSVELQKQ